MVRRGRVKKGFGGEEDGGREVREEEGRQGERRGKGEERRSEQDERGKRRRTKEGRVVNISTFHLIVPKV